MYGYDALCTLWVLNERPLSKVEGDVYCSFELNLRAHSTLLCLCTQVVSVKRVTLGDTLHRENAVYVFCELSLTWIGAVSNCVIKATLTLLINVFIIWEVISAGVRWIGYWALIRSADSSEIRAYLFNGRTHALVGTDIDGETTLAELTIDQSIGHAVLNVQVTPSKCSSLWIEVQIEALFRITLCILSIHIPTEMPGWAVKWRCALGSLDP